VTGNAAFPAVEVESMREMTHLSMQAVQMAAESAAGKKAALTKKRKANRTQVIEMRHTDIHHALRIVGLLSDDYKTDKARIMMFAKQLRERVASGEIEKVGSLYRMKIRM
jgi:hypothetical protein